MTPRTIEFSRQHRAAFAAQGTDQVRRGNSPPREPGRIPVRAYHTGLYLTLAAIVMLFAGFTSALVVRKGISSDWNHVALPRILYVGTALLVGSSLWLEWTRRQFRARPSGGSLRIRLAPVVLLGLAFVICQLVAWRELQDRGIWIGANPGASFFYLLTAAHGVHVLGGLGVLSYVVVRGTRLAATAGERAALDLASIYWHFMSGLWGYLLVLLATNL